VIALDGGPMGWVLRSDLRAGAGHLTPGGADRRARLRQAEAVRSLRATRFADITLVMTSARIRA
jgi:hypothetical protein